MIRNVTILVGIIAVVALAGLPEHASAAKKMSLAQAWKACKAQIDKDLPVTTDNQNERYLRGGACLKKFGYDL